MTRFKSELKNLDEALDYLMSRAKQLLRHGYKLIRVEVNHWGINGIFEDKNQDLYQSIILLKHYTRKKLYKELIRHTILTSTECNIEWFLMREKIDFISHRLNYSAEYSLIENYYGDKKANRSGVYLMNHIDEGLYILNEINASEMAKNGYCLHPIVQTDECLVDNMELLSDIDTNTMMLAMEYRSVANEYLSNREIKSIDEIRLSPLKDVNDMLIADKIQNRKDFDIYHKDTHPRSVELDRYFQNWFDRLNITDEFYKKCFDFCK